MSTTSDHRVVQAKSTSSSSAAPAGVSMQADPGMPLVVNIHGQAYQLATSAPDAAKRFASKCAADLTRICPDISAEPLCRVVCDQLHPTKLTRVQANSQLDKGAVIASLPVESAFLLLPLENITSQASFETAHRHARSETSSKSGSDFAQKRRASILPSNLRTWESVNLRVSSRMSAVVLKQTNSDAATERKRLRQLSDIKLARELDAVRTILYKMTRPSIVWLLMQLRTQPSKTVHGVIDGFLEAHAKWAEFFKVTMFQSKDRFVSQFAVADQLEFEKNVTEFYAVVEESLHSSHRHQWHQYAREQMPRLFLFDQVFMKVALRVDVPGSSVSTANDIYIVHPLTSAINHSCAANAMLRFCGDALVLVALRPIPADAEITIDYMQLAPVSNYCSPALYTSMAVDQRARLLAASTGIVSCFCQLCMYDRAYCYAYQVASQGSETEPTILTINHTAHELKETVRRARILSISDSLEFMKNYPHLVEKDCVGLVPKMDVYGGWADAFSAYSLGKMDVFDETNHVHLMVLSVMCRQLLMTPVEDVDGDARPKLSALMNLCLSAMNRLVGYKSGTRKDTPRSAGWTSERRSVIANAASVFTESIIAPAIDHFYAAYARAMIGMTTLKIDRDQVSRFHSSQCRLNLDLVRIAVHNCQGHAFVPGLTSYLVISSLMRADAFESFIAMLVDR